MCSESLGETGARNGRVPRAPGTSSTSEPSRGNRSRPFCGPHCDRRRNQSARNSGVGLRRSERPTPHRRHPPVAPGPSRHIHGAARSQASARDRPAWPRWLADPPGCHAVPAPSARPLGSRSGPRSGRCTWTRDHASPAGSAPRTAPSPRRCAPARQRWPRPCRDAARLRFREVRSLLPSGRCSGRPDAPAPGRARRPRSARWRPGVRPDLLPRPQHQISFSMD